LIVVLDGARVDCDGTPIAAITDEMLRNVVDIRTSVGNTPASGAPFVLPQAMTVANMAAANTTAANGSAYLDLLTRHLAL
jgi:hypothetical protein